MDRTRQSWEAMWARCTNSNHVSFKYYGGRGVSVCKRWESFKYFLRDMGERPKNKTLDRFPDVNGDYRPGNCRWATWKQQAANRRRMSPPPYKTKPYEFFARTGSLLGIDIRRLRIERNWTVYQLAEKMNVRAATVSRWERGLSHPYSKEIPKLEKIFKIKIRRISLNGRER